MSNGFPLEIITPEQEFWQDDAEALSLQTPLGSLTVLAGHAPLVANVPAQQLRVRRAGEWKDICCTEGFLEVRPDRVLLFVQDCAWPEDMPAHAELDERARAEELALRSRSLYEHQSLAIQLTRAMVRLQRPKLTQQD